MYTTRGKIVFHMVLWSVSIVQHESCYWLLNTIIAANRNSYGSIRKLMTSSKPGPFSFSQLHFLHSWQQPLPMQERQTTQLHATHPHPLPTCTRQLAMLSPSQEPSLSVPCPTLHSQNYYNWDSVPNCLSMRHLAVLTGRGMGGTWPWEVSLTLHPRLIPPLQVKIEVTNVVWHIISLSCTSLDSTVLLQ